MAPEELSGLRAFYQTNRAMRKIEESHHMAICKWLKLQHPEIIFTSEQSGLRVDNRKAKFLKATRNPARGLPDIWIMQRNEIWSGLFLEVKADIDAVLTKKGLIRQEQHIQEQHRVLKQLRTKGYFSTFVIGFDHAKEIIEAYLDNRRATLNKKAII